MNMQSTAKSLGSFLGGCLLAAPVDAANDHLRECLNHISRDFDVIPKPSRYVLTFICGLICYHLLEMLEEKFIDKAQKTLPAVRKVACASMAIVMCYQHNISPTPVTVTMQDQRPRFSRLLPTPHKQDPQRRLAWRNRQGLIFYPVITRSSAQPGQLAL